MERSFKVAYLEHEPVHRHTIDKWLSSENLDCQTFPTMLQLKQGLNRVGEFDIVILDLQSQRGNSGMEALHYIRHTLDSSLPVLVVSSSNYSNSALDALEAGANDFLSKPLTKGKLLIHLHRLLRPVESGAPKQSYYPFELNEIQSQIMLKGDRLDLTKSEFSLASLLLKHFGKVLSYEVILNRLALGSAPTSIPSIERDISKLVRKMGLHTGEEGWRLERVYRHGYRLISGRYDDRIA